MTSVAMPIPVKVTPALAHHPASRRTSTLLFSSRVLLFICLFLYSMYAIGKQQKTEATSKSTTRKMCGLRNPHRMSKILSIYALFIPGARVDSSSTALSWYKVAQDLGKGSATCSAISFIPFSSCCCHSCLSLPSLFVYDCARSLDVLSTSQSVCLSRTLLHFATSTALAWKPSASFFFFDS